MNQADIEMLASEVGPVIKEIVAPLLARISALEDALKALPEPRDGKDADPKEVADLVLKSLPEPASPPPPVSEEVIGERVAAAVKAAIEALPEPRDGKDGTSIRLEDVAPLIAAEVAKAVDAIPKPKDGEDGADGVGMAGALIDRGGNLVMTLTNGETKSLGRVVGDDGQPGTDGVGFDDLDFGYDGERTVTFKFVRGDRVVERSFEVPVLIDRGVYAEREYAKGDVVSHGGCMWIAQTKTSARPGSGEDWRLSVKKGRDGKDGELKPPAEPKQVRLK